MDYAEAIGLFSAEPPAGTPVPAVVESPSPARRLRDALEPLSMHAVWSRHTNAALAEHASPLDDLDVADRIDELPNGAVG
jgi:hypothetical protein